MSFGSGRRVLVVMGTRPEAIKLAPVVHEFAQQADVSCRICFTGQHREMVESLFELFGMRADLDLQVMQHDQSLHELAGRALTLIGEQLKRLQPDLVVVQGDTTTAFCATFAAYMQRIPVAHVEAGLRTHNLLSPWPEEGNRQLIGRLAALHLSPTETAKQNLLAEGVAEDRIAVTGNTVVDALLWTAKRERLSHCHAEGLPDDWRERWADRRIVLITGHRRENFGEGLANVWRGLVQLARQFPQDQFVFPVHLNPNVRASVDAIIGPVVSELGNFHLIEPLAYEPFVALLSRAHLVISDSGGIQEEAPSLGKPVLVTRNNTERGEAIAAGTARLVGTDTAELVAQASALLGGGAAYERMVKARNPFGDGAAAQRTVTACLRFLTKLRPLLPAPFTG